MTDGRRSAQRVRWRYAAVVPVLLVALAACSGGPSVQERSRTEVRAKVTAAQGRFEQVLRTPGDSYADRARSAVGDDQFPVTLVTEAREQSGMVEVVAIVTAKTTSTKHGYAEDYAARACIRLSARPGADATATVADVNCPDVRTAEPADETISVA
ncbi:hypothetical protein [Kribbella sp. NPDC006257]|uniref:hypothetical protein n=1 Tax=Kribbella sp. NPDC006257 TaxID=3156738 RepID=UPI0033B24D86